MPLAGNGDMHSLTPAILLAVSLGACCASALGGGGTWIWYPGDYALWRGNDLQARRIEHGGGYPVFWATYAHHPLVDFVKKVDLDSPEAVDIAWEGTCRIMGWGATEPMPGVVSNRYVFPAGKYTVVARVYSQGKPPAIYINGPRLKTDSTWTADWRTVVAGLDGKPSPPAETLGAFDSAERRPSETRMKTVRRRPVSLEKGDGGRVFADFGEETFGTLRISEVSGAGRIRIVYGESEPEAREENSNSVDQWEYVSAKLGVSEVRLDVSRGFRYVHLIPEDGVSIGSVEMDEELCPLPRRGAFRCSDELLNRVWEVSAHTLEITTRELFIEGAKRDRWTWSGDARQSYLMSYYLFGGSDTAKDTLFYQRGGDPLVMHINQIMDYTFYWFLSVWEYYMHTGDRLFLEQVVTRMESLMDFVLSRLDAAGRPHDRTGDWIFIDWAPEELHNKGGVTSFEQMLLSESLAAMANVLDELGRDGSAAYRRRAKSLRMELVPLFWSEEKGGLMHLLRDDGTLDKQMTRYPNMFGLGWGYFDDRQRESVLKNVIFNEAVMKIQTPYMRFYELDALCGLGMRRRVLDDVRAYWGGMLKEGATSFWELYNPGEKGREKYAMYRRPFGKSLCHAWGAGPVYLFGRHLLGVRPTRPGFAQYEVRPDLAGLEWMDGSVPTPHGEVRVSFSGEKISVSGDGRGRGILVLPDGSRHDIPSIGNLTIPR